MICTESTPATPLPLQLNIIGGDEESGLIGASFISMTTFDQAKEILRYFKDGGVESVDAVLVGWAKRGESVENPDRFPAARDLGGDSGLASLAAYATSLGDSLYLSDDNLSLNNHKGVRVRTDAIYNIQNNPLFDGWIANASRMVTSFDQALEKYQNYGISGVQEDGVGWLLLTDYSQISPTTREQMKQAQRELLLRMKKEFGGLRLDSSNAYALMDDLTLTYLSGSSYLTILDESVPFLHHCPAWAGGLPVRQLYELLRAVDADAGCGGHGREHRVLGKLGTHGKTEVRRFSQALQHGIRPLEGRHCGTVRQAAGVFPKDQRQFHCRICQAGCRRVVLTTYDNGVRVLVNYTDEAVDYLGITVPAQDFAVVEGGE